MKWKVITNIWIDMIKKIIKKSEHTFNNFFLHFIFNQFFSVVVMKFLHSKRPFADIYCHFIQDLTLSVLICIFNCTGKSAVTFFYNKLYSQSCIIVTTHCLYNKNFKYGEKKCNSYNGFCVASCVSLGITYL